MSNLFKFTLNKGSRIVSNNKLNIRLFSTKDVDNKTPSPTTNPNNARGDQARGAMKSFMEGVSKPNDGGGSKAGLWANIKSKSDNTSQQPRSTSNFQSRSTFVNKNSQNSQNSQNNNESTGVLRSLNNDSSPNRVRNTRNTSAGVGANKSGGFSDTGSGGNSTGGSKFKPKGGKRKQFDREDRPRDSYNEAIPPMMANALFDMDHFATYVDKGKVIPDRGMDDIDKFLANMFIESTKTESHEVRTVVESPKFRRSLIPKARPLSSLIQSMQPRIYEANAYGSDGYKLGTEAWEVVSKNYYYSDNDRYYICNGIARYTDKIMSKLEKEMNVPVDMVFEQNFRKGYLGIEDERRRRLLLDEIPVNDSDYIQSETNWKQEAFIDEDQL